MAEHLRKYSWFGRIVQWNGLCLATAYLDLAEFDDRFPRRRVAESIIRSAIHQQAADGEDVALWPDSISAVEGDKSAWVFSPHQILSCILKLLGRDDEPRTVFLGRRNDRIPVSTIGVITNAEWKDGAILFTATYPAGEQGTVLLANVSRPRAVSLDGSPISERDDVVKGSDPGWTYNEAAAFLTIRIATSEANAVRIDNVLYRHVERLAQPKDTLDFVFDKDADGWLPQHDIGDMGVKDGVLTGKIFGADPFFGRGMLSVAPDKYRAVEFRLRVSAGNGGQFYWGTATASGFSEDRVALFDLVADGQFHTYHIDLSKHPQWVGRKITAIRIDPGNGAATGDFAVEYVRGVS